MRQGVPQTLRSLIEFLASSNKAKTSQLLDIVVAVDGRGGGAAVGSGRGGKRGRGRGGGKNGVIVAATALFFQEFADVAVQPDARELGVGHVAGAGDEAAAGGGAAEALEGLGHGPFC